MEAIDSYSFISHEPAAAPIDDSDHATAEARKLLFSEDTAPIAGDFAASLDKVRKALNTQPTTPAISAAVAAAEAAVEEARIVMGVNKVETKPLPLQAADEVAETFAYYSEFKKNSISESIGEYTIHIKEAQDEHGRQFYEFDNGRSKPLLACLFTTAAGQLISLNGVVMPLSSFQNIVYARTAPATLPKEAQRNPNLAGADLRATIPVSDDKVLCTLTDWQQITIPDTTVRHVMMALQRLAPPARRTETETEAEPAEKQAEEQEEEQEEKQEEEQEEEHVGLLRRLWRWLY